MSKLTRVVVLCPNGKRQAVNLSPNISILQILEEVCLKQHLNPDDFDICHYNKPMDLTLPARFANLSNNAQLELQPVKQARKDCLVTVGLQLESGERIMKDFVPSTSLWDVVEQCLSTKSDKIHLDDKTEPICVYMRQKLVGNAIRETTLRGLGLTKGSAIIRLLYRNPEDLSSQAHVSTPLPKAQKDISTANSESLASSSYSEMECDPPIGKVKAPAEKGNAKNINISSTKTSNKQDSTLDSSSGNNQRNLMNDTSANKKNVVDDTVNRDVPYEGTKNYNDLCKARKELPNSLLEQKMECDSVSMDQDPPEEVEEIGAIHYIGNRHAVLYSLDDISDVRKADLPDEFFELTIDDVKYLMEEFKKTRVSLENQPLLTKELRKRQILQKLGRFKETVIRVYFPERLVLQAVFEAQETVQDVCDFIRNYLEDRSTNFYLYTTPPKERKDPGKTLIESMLIPAAVMYFGCDRHDSSYLSSTLKEKISDPRAAALAARESRKQAECEIEEISSEQLDGMSTNMVEPEVEVYRVAGPSFAQTSNTPSTSGKPPKWLKLSRN